jgi:uncharacterized protein (TIGR02757 family)
MIEVQRRLDAQVHYRNNTEELSGDKPDPLMIARRYNDEHHALTCALFAYGNVRSIVAFLETIDPLWMDAPAENIHTLTSSHYYRFQNSEDIAQWLITLGRLKSHGGAQAVFGEGYNKNGVLAGVGHLIEMLYDLNPYRSRGYTFLIGKPIKKIEKASAMKRWMMYLRWMVRCDALDMGLWSCCSPPELIMPLDTHTFAVSRHLGLLQRNQCDMKAAIELTQKLKEFDVHDPIKYDFALYRIGQEKILLS